MRKLVIGLLGTFRRLSLAARRRRGRTPANTRLRAEHLLRRHPEILDLDPGRILLIAGLQRTATTTLHRLLAADPGIRASCKLHLCAAGSTTWHEG